MTEGYLWTGQYPETQRIIDQGNNQSMELDTNTLDAYWTKDNNGKPQFFIINEAIISKLCILGEDCEPCFEGATISNVQFSFEDNFKKELFSLIEKMQEILSKDEGGTPVFNTYAVEIGCTLWDAIYDYIYNQFGLDENYCLKYTIDGVYEDGNQKFAILRNRKDLTFYRLNFALTEEGGFQPMEELSQVSPDFKPAETPQFSAEEITAYEAAFVEGKKENVEDPKPDADPEPEEEPESEPESKEDPEEEPVEGEDEKNKYSLDEVVEYQELLEKYSNLESKVNELTESINNYTAQIEGLNSTIEQLKNENNSLTEFKVAIDREKKQELINSFYMLSDDLKKDCVDNIDTYSLDEIEAKLSVICVRNKVSFDLDKPEDKKEVVFNLDEINNDPDMSLPAWVQRVQEVAKEKNI